MQLSVPCGHNKPTAIRHRWITIGLMGVFVTLAIAFSEFTPKALVAGAAAMFLVWCITSVDIWSWRYFARRQPQIVKPVQRLYNTVAARQSGTTRPWVFMAEGWAAVITENDRGTVLTMYDGATARWFGWYSNGDACYWQRLQPFKVTSYAALLDMACELAGQGTPPHKEAVLPTPLVLDQMKDNLVRAQHVTYASFQAGAGQAT